MRLKHLAVRAFGAAVLVALGAGCSSGGSQFAPSGSGAAASHLSSRHVVPNRSVSPNGIVSLLPPGIQREPQPSWMRLAAAGPLGKATDILWVSGFGFPAPVGQYTVPNPNNNGPNCETPALTGVNNLGVDPKGNLWVPVANNGPGTGYVQQYDCNGPVGKAIVDPDGQPSDVAVDGNGNIYVGNIVDFYPEDGGYYLASGTVDIYNSHHVFTGKFSDPSFFSPHVPGFDIYNALTGVAVDPQGNCYVSHQADTGGGEVVEFPGCKPANRGKVLGGPHPWSPGKAQFDQAGNLFISDYSFGGYYRNEYIAVYAPPYDKPATKTFPLYGPPIACPLSTDEKHIYCANYINGTVDVYTYPVGRYIYSFNNGLQTYGATGIALAPSGSN